MNVFEILSLRSEFEDLVLNMRVPGPRKAGTLENLSWFIEHGTERNQKFNGITRALEIARTIVEHERCRKKRK